MCVVLGFGKLAKWPIKSTNYTVELLIYLREPLCRNMTGAFKYLAGDLVDLAMCCFVEEMQENANYLGAARHMNSHFYVSPK
ncbi:hypothetical protein C7U92_21130 [Bradyrhizobium sp. WBOS7]|uniref:Uncharacterized protein n=1 Tax=Bradyrhizobium betae TaxID=244734 RepID=A0AAE9N7C8_9BRAD|nr:hypothetical protein [Bradyrhizobium sp. WBOS2]MDD1575093.1 hypothetical protein [Bradyrhizobium sp. WBOS1]MDD1579201.1 hypothetical protein [Bradyrhizobium sp. WBOS7]MDD1605052.1 hypothetical protein [Bradyrhizobium sp. WBOS16]UUO33651.1 hypothetical protein DCK84_03075 [Bradyrhizobium sp. WBOS01]UUO40208.1 hypothetical protein DCM75_05205 [Bradyrhizobium sp. WBOS02]UUO52186.1 hypothetical protein DCM79_03790 [Bradyrhizobium sp. WBOS07]UUO64353.1 hypothetical protein DCM83_03400 [Bradyrh